MDQVKRNLIAGIGSIVIGGLLFYSGIAHNRLEKSDMPNSFEDARNPNKLERLANQYKNIDPRAISFLENLETLKLIPPILKTNEFIEGPKYSGKGFESLIYKIKSGGELIFEMDNKGIKSYKLKNTGLPIQNPKIKTSNGEMQKFERYKEVEEVARKCLEVLGKGKFEDPSLYKSVFIGENVNLGYYSFYFGPKTTQGTIKTDKDEWFQIPVVIAVDGTNQYLKSITLGDENQWMRNQSRNSIRINQDRYMVHQIIRKGPRVSLIE